jgi:hypothetical protein
MLLSFNRSMLVAIGLFLVLACQAGADTITAATITETSLSGVPAASASYTDISFSSPALSSPTTYYTVPMSLSSALAAPSADAPLASLNLASGPSLPIDAASTATLVAPPTLDPVTSVGADAGGIPDLHTHHVPFVPAAATPLPSSAWGGIVLLGGMGLWNARRRISRGFSPTRN